MAVNLSVISHYFIGGGRRSGGAVLWNLLIPAAGFPVCFYVFTNLSTTAKIIGVVWCVAGVVHACLLTGGFRREIVSLSQTAP